MTRRSTLFLPICGLDNGGHFTVKFESFLNVAEEDQARVLNQLTTQEQLYLAFYDDDLQYRFSKEIEHGQQQGKQLEQLVEEAHLYWNTLPPDRRDFDQAKAEFIQRFI